MAVISSATKRNFEKLNKDIDSHQFTSRANKRDSRKNIIPREYYTNKNNVEKITNLVEEIKSLPKATAFDSLILLFLESKNLVQIEGTSKTSSYAFVNQFIQKLDFDEKLRKLELPKDERDPLGLIYQQYITEGEKNKKGSYYTPQKIVSDLLNLSHNVAKDKSFCDPCCGTGGFLLEAVKVFAPEKVYGFDLDPYAVKIAKANLFARFPEVDFNKNIQCKNFLLEQIPTYDYFITNPPWGSMTHVESLPTDSCVKSEESFSYFLEKALNSVSEKGYVDFLLPISILNVKVHKDIRDFILAGSKIQQINTYGKCFKGVLTDVISLKVCGNQNKNIVGTDPNPTPYSNTYSYKVKTVSGREFFCSIENVWKDKNHNISLLDQIDTSIISKIQGKAKYNLQKASFALGIVTGNNKELLKTEAAADLRPIITGKEVKKYFIKTPENFIAYKREAFQQICPDYFFQAKSKFLYKFISKKMVFALDENQYLALNSANLMVLPEDFELNKYVVLALLNSDLFNFYYIKQIGQIKILKDDIQNLPLPELNHEQQKKITTLVKELLAQGSYDSCNFDSIESYLFKLYDLTEEEVYRIKETLN